MLTEIQMSGSHDQKSAWIQSPYPTQPCKPLKKNICQSLKVKRDRVRVIWLCIQINMQVNSKPWQTARKTTQEGGDWEMESDRVRAEMNEQEWENAIEAGGFCWLVWASLCQPLWEAQISIRSASLCAWQRVYRGSFLNQASPTAGTAPDKGPIWRGFLSPRTSAGKRLRRTNERFCGGKSRAWRSTRQTEREEINKGWWWWWGY